MCRKSTVVSSVHRNTAMTGTFLIDQKRTVLSNDCRNTAMTGTFLIDQKPTLQQQQKHAVAVKTGGRKFQTTDTVVLRRASFTTTRSDLYKQSLAKRQGSGSRLIMPPELRTSSRTSRTKRHNNMVMSKITQESKAFRTGSSAHVTARHRERLRRR